MPVLEVGVRTGERTLRFHALLGRGGFGTVYLATLHGAAGFRRRVAVKLLHAGLDGHADLQARQRDEARLLGLLHHPALVSVLELASVGQRPAVVMEYVEAVDVATLQAALPMGRMPLRALAELVAAVADALDSAWHARDPDDGSALRVVHRDIKPSNVLLTPDGQVKVLDFGIARFDADTREGHTSRIVLGTPRYMAPESWSGEPPAHALDIYALGATAWELWSGRPWERSADRDQHEARIAAAAALHTGLPPAVEDLLRAMVAWEPSRRPGARQVHGTLRAWCAHAGPIGGDSLASIAARYVPAQRAARAEALAGEALPSPAALAGGTSVDRAPAARAAAIRRVTALGWVAVLLALLGWMRLREPGSAAATVRTEAPPDHARESAGGGPMRADEPSPATAPSLSLIHI